MPPGPSAERAAAGSEQAIRPDELIGRDRRAQCGERRCPTERPRNGRDNPMIYFDAALLNVIERLCHWFQRLTGRTNVWLALQLTNLSVIVYFTGAAMYFWSLELAPRI